MKDIPDYVHARTVAAVLVVRVQELAGCHRSVLKEGFVDEIPKAVVTHLDFLPLHSLTC